MEQYGEFSASISSLESNLGEVRCVWTDETARTYDSINDNIKAFAMQIWAYYCNSVEGYEIVQSNYNEADFEDELRQLNAKIESV